jgi:hypothetical protein
MQRNLWNSLKASVLLWRWALPGMVVIGLVMAARLTGSLQRLGIAVAGCVFAPSSD